MSSSDAGRDKWGREQEPASPDPIDLVRNGETPEIHDTFEAPRRLREVARAVPRMQRIAGTLDTRDAGAIAAEAVADQHPEFRGGTINFTISVDTPDSVIYFRPTGYPDRRTLVRFRRGDRIPQAERRLRPDQAAFQADFLLMKAGLHRGHHPIRAPQALYIGSERSSGESTGVWQYFLGLPVDEVWPEPPWEAQTAIADVVLAFAAFEPALTRRSAPDEPRTCGEAHYHMLRHFQQKVEPYHWDTFGPAFEAIGAQCTRLRATVHNYVHSHPDAPARLTHNDPKPSNVLVQVGRNGDGDQRVLAYGVVDWDLATLGDPAFDLAASPTPGRRMSVKPPAH